MVDSDAQEKTIETREETNNGTRRMILVLISIVLELAVDAAIIFWLTSYAGWVLYVIRLLAVFLVIGIYSMDVTSTMKMPWMLLIMVTPILGSTLFLFCGLNRGLDEMRKRYEAVDERLWPLLPTNERALEATGALDGRIRNICAYLKEHSHYPTYDDSDITYYDDAATGLDAQIEELERAERFIFMEYHAIENAESWERVATVLEEKAKAGLDVRVFYDDMGSISFINTDFCDLMRARGIRCRVFNPFKVGLKLFLNNRDHRKITVIDGRVGFTGGYNIANEYFHLTSPFGFWKDTGVKIEGEAVKSLTVAFLEMWNSMDEADNDTEYGQFLPDVDHAQREAGTIIVPYADSPLDQEQVGENVYLSVAEYARDYVWFVTPYLILTDEMTHTLALAAKRGVDVRIITPGIPDKPLIYSVTRSYYHNLVRCGVRVFEFTPGFVHAKMSVADDAVATCGTINLDYRSLYHHFENGCLYANCQAVADTKHDFESMFAQSKEVTQDYMQFGAGIKLKQLLLRLFAALL